MEALLTEDPGVMSVVACRDIALEYNKIGMIIGLGYLIASDICATHT